MLAPTALPLSSLPVARSLQSLQGIPTLSNAVESLFSLAPPSPAINIGAVKQEQSKGSTTLKRRSSSSSSTAQEVGVVQRKCWQRNYIMDRHNFTLYDRIFVHSEVIPVERMI